MSSMEKVARELRSVWYEFHFWRADENQDFDRFVESLTLDRLDEMVELASVHEGSDFSPTRHPITWHIRSTPALTQA